MIDYKLIHNEYGDKSLSWLWEFYLCIIIFSLLSLNLFHALLFGIAIYEMIRLLKEFPFKNIKAYLKSLDMGKMYFQILLIVLATNLVIGINHLSFGILSIGYFFALYMHKSNT